MGSALRSRYDKCYIGVETWLLAREARRDGKRYAAGLGPSAQTEAGYAAARAYWGQFRVAVPKKFWFTLFANDRQSFSPLYIPDDLWFRRIIPHYNNLIFAKALQDKCLHNLLFPDVRRPTTVVKRVAGVFYDDALTPLSRQEALERCHGRGRVIVKPSVGSGQGHSIRFFDSDGLSDRELEDVFRQAGDNFIIQEKLAQHPALARFNPGSLNTVRVLTFFHGGQVHVLSTILRVGGAASEVDNISQGGLQYTLSPEGRALLPGFTHEGDRWSYTDGCPNGIDPAEAVIPSFDSVLALAKTQAARLGHFKLVGWDIAVADDGEPVLVEFNVIPGQNQESDGPTFGALTDQVLEEVFGRRNAP